MIVQIDDLQWADVASRDVLHYAAKRWMESGTRVLLLLGLRSEALISGSDLDSWLAGLGRDVALTKIQLGALTLADVESVVSSLSAGAGASAEFAAWLHRETGGQPFFMTETLRALLEAGHLRARHDGDQWALEIHPGLERRVDLRDFLPPGVQQVIRARLERLTPNARAFLSAGAVLGEAFTFEQLCQVAGISENDALSAIDELVRAHLLREVTGPDRPAAIYYFTHDKIRDVVHADASDARRQVFHRRALEMLRTTDAPAAKIARHAMAAGLDEIAAIANLGAGDDAMHLLAASDAIVHYTRAMELATRLGRLDLAVDAQVRRARARATLAKWSDAKGDLESVLEKLDPSASERRAELLVALSEANFWLLDVPAVMTYAKSAVPLANAIGRIDLEMGARGWLAGALAADCELDAAIQHHEHAVGLASTVGMDPPAHVLTFHALVLYWQGRGDEALARSRASVDAARASNDVSLMMYSLSHLGLSLAAIGQYGDALVAYDEARRYGREYRIHSLLARAIAMSTGVHLDLFDFVRAEELSLEARELALSAGWPPAAASASIDLLFNFVRRGEVGRAEEMIGTVAETVKKAAGFHGWLWRLRLDQVQAEIAVARGDWSLALQRSRANAEHSLKSRRIKYRVLALIAAARALSESGRAKEAIIDLREALPLARAMGDPALLLRVSALLLSLDGDDALAIEMRATIESVLHVLPDDRVKKRFEEGIAEKGLGRPVRQERDG